MKLTRKLIPAFIMLLVSAVLMSTASFAWFAMNNNVTATGMSVSAKADSIFLEIKGTEDTDWTTAGTNDFSASLYPVAHKTFGDGNAATIETDTNWFYKYVKYADDHETGAGDAQEIGAFSDYVAKTSYTIRLNPNMVKTGYDLYVSKITIPADTGITVIIQCGTKYQEFSETSNNIEWSAEKTLVDVMTDAEMTVNVYIYINGEDENVYTNNAAALTGDIDFALSLSGTDRG